VQRAELLRQRERRDEHRVRSALYRCQLRGGRALRPDIGRCQPDTCIGGTYTCPAHTHCQDTAGGDPHGCARDACAFDADCGCGAACIGGSCYDTLGTCASPAA